MRHPLALPLAAALLGGCAADAAPPSGTWRVDMVGTRTVYLDAADPGTTEELSASSWAAVYVDEGVNGADLSFTFASQGLTPPADGRQFEMRLFPSTFPDDTSSVTLAGIFYDEDGVEAIGQAQGGGANVTVQYPDQEEPITCPYYERYRVTYLVGTWTESQWDVGLDVAYEESCLMADGTALRDGYPRTIYALDTTLEPAYTPVEEPDAAREVLR